MTYFDARFPIPSKKAFIFDSTAGAGIAEEKLRLLRVRERPLEPAAQPETSGDAQRAREEDGPKKKRKIRSSGGVMSQLSATQND